MSFCLFVFTPNLHEAWRNINCPYMALLFLRIPIKSTEKIINFQGGKGLHLKIQAWDIGPQCPQVPRRRVQKMYSVLGPTTVGNGMHLPKILSASTMAKAQGKCSTWQTTWGSVLRMDEIYLAAHLRWYESFKIDLNVFAVIFSNFILIKKNYL